MHWLLSKGLFSMRSKNTLLKKIQGTLKSHIGSRLTKYSSSKSSLDIHFVIRREQSDVGMVNGSKNH